MIVNAYLVKELISNIREGFHKGEEEDSPQKPQLWGIYHISADVQRGTPGYQ